MAWRPFQKIREAQFARAVYKKGTEEILSNGFKLVSSDLKAAGVVLPVRSNGFTERDVEAMIAKCEAEGVLSPQILNDAAEKAGLDLAAVGEGGGILDFFRRIIDWLSDPENQEKLLAVIKFFMMLLAMFGI